MAATSSRMAAWYAKPVRIILAHRKLAAAIALGIVFYIALSNELRVTTRLLLAWNVSVLIYLAAAIAVIRQCELSQVRRRAQVEDEGAALILALTLAAATAALAAIFIELGAVRGQSASGWYVALAVVTGVLSWAFIHVIFAFHYAHEFYGDGRDGQKGGLKFPAEERPDYLDFLYFSFVIGMTFQVSDVQVTSKTLRRVVVAHGAFSFFYNVAVLALMVNIGGEFIR
jgi:uncharacterized membrane protein